MTSRSKSTTPTTACSTVVMMVLPPGAPTTRRSDASVPTTSAGTSPPRSILQGRFEQPEQFAVIVDRLELGKLSYDVLRRVEQVPEIRLAQHRGVVE